MRKSNWIEFPEGSGVKIFKNLLSCHHREAIISHQPLKYEFSIFFRTWFSVSINAAPFRGLDLLETLWRLTIPIQGCTVLRVKVFRKAAASWRWFSLESTNFLGKPMKGSGILYVSVWNGWKRGYNRHFYIIFDHPKWMKLLSNIGCSSLFLASSRRTCTATWMEAGGQNHGKLPILKMRRMKWKWREEMTWLALPPEENPANKQPTPKLLPEDINWSIFS